jgi:hypothetical protein
MFLLAFFLGGLVPVVRMGMFERGAYVNIRVQWGVRERQQQISVPNEHRLAEPL